MGVALVPLAFLSPRIDPRPAITNYVNTHQVNEATYPSLAVLIRDIAQQIQWYASLAKIPAAAVAYTRNDMYLASEAIRFLQKDKEKRSYDRGNSNARGLQEGSRRRHNGHSQLGEGIGSSDWTNEAACLA
jgi:hypothetical protein